MSEAAGVGALIPDGLAGAVATVVTNARTIKAQHIVAERARWRDKLRGAIEQAVSDRNKEGWRSLWLVLKMNTNPLHADDRKIVALAKDLERGKSRREEELLDRLALLLKHDWERAKREAGNDALPARRINYEGYLALVRGRSSDALKCWSGQWQNF